MVSFLKASRRAGDRGGPFAAVTPVLMRQPRVRGIPREPVGEGGLADASLAADQDEAAPASARRGQSVVQDGEFAVAPDEGRRCDRRWRTDVHARPRRRGADG